MDIAKAKSRLTIPTVDVAGDGLMRMFTYETVMLRGHIKGAASAIYSILYTARAEYKIYCPGADILPKGTRY